MMKALLIKDLRMQRHVMVLALLLLCGPCVVYTLVELSSVPPGGRAWSRGWASARESFGAMAATGAGLSLLALPALYGVAAARERRDRSGEFLESLPVSRRRIVSSRLLAATLCALTAPVLGLGAAFLLDPTLLPDLIDSPNLVEEPGPFLVLGGVSTFLVGMAWMAGAADKSEVRAALCSILTVLGVMIAVYLILDRMQRHGAIMSGATITAIFALTAGTLGVSSFVAGLAIAIRRRTP